MFSLKTILVVLFLLLSPSIVLAETVILVPLPLKNLDTGKTEEILSALKTELEKKRLQVRRAEVALPSTFKPSHNSRLADALEKAAEYQLNSQDKEAIALVQGSVESIKARPDSLADLSKLADAYLFMAYCAKNLGDAVSMERMLDEAARLNPNLIPDGELFPPSLINQFEVAKNRIWSRGKFSQITINSEPEGASVFVNGSFKGNAPMRLEHYPVGDHYLFLKKGSLESSRKISLIENQNPSLSFKLSARFRRSAPATSSSSSLLAPNQFKEQAIWIQKAMSPQANENVLAVGVVSKGKKMDLIIHPIGFSSSKPSIYKLGSEASLNDQATTLLEPLLKKF